MPEPGCSARWSASQASRCSAVLRRTTPSRSDSRSRRAAQHQDVPVAELLGDVGGHPGVGGGGRGQHRDAVGQVAEQGADPAVVGPEVVAPVGDAVRLVDDQQPAGGGQPGQHLVAEARVVEPLGADQQHVDLAGADRVLDRLPVLDVGGVDRHRADAGALGGGDLVAHQREQRRDDHGRAGALLAQQQGRHEVDRRLAPAGALHDQRAAAVHRQRLDRRPLVLAQHGVVACPTSARRWASALRRTSVSGRRSCRLSTSDRPQWPDRTSPGWSCVPAAGGRVWAGGGLSDRRSWTTDVTARSVARWVSRPADSLLTLRGSLGVAGHQEQS